MTEKIKVLAFGDYVTSTGFGSVMSNIWSRLYKTGKYDLDVVGINYSGDPYDTEKYPGNVYTAMSALNMQPPYNEPYGRQKLLDTMGLGNYDVVFMLQDTFIMQTIATQIEEIQNQIPNPFKTVYYFPIDATPKTEWITESVSKMDYPVAYTHYGYNECIKVDPSLKDRLKIVYHGNNFNDIYYVEDRKSVAEFRKAAFRGEADGKFLILNVNRNQRRKDIARSLMVLKEIKDRGHDDVLLYLHMSPNDVGGNIFDMAEAMGLKMGVDYVVPENFSPHTGMPLEILNMVYNAADAYLTTTHSEGWGLSITEAMSTKTPVVAPNNSSITEILAENRGCLVDSGANPSMWIIKDQDNDRMRPLMDVEQAADKIIDIKNGILPDVEGAYKWVNDLNWDNIAAEWDQIITEAHNAPKKKLNKPPVGLNRAERRKKK